MYIIKPTVGQEGYKIKYSHLGTIDNLGVLETEEEAIKVIEQSNHKRYCTVVKVKYNGTWWEEYL